jgi:hypothetical protein
MQTNFSIRRSHGSIFLRLRDRGARRKALRIAFRLFLAGMFIAPVDGLMPVEPPQTRANDTGTPPPTETNGPCADLVPSSSGSGASGDLCEGGGGQCTSPSGIGSPGGGAPNAATSDTPVQLLRGAAVEAEIDLIVPGPVKELDFKHWRTYDSRNKGQASASGDRWMCAARNPYLVEVGNDILLRFHAGSKRTFTGPPSGGFYTIPVGWHAALEKKTSQSDAKDYDLDGSTTDVIDYFILTMPDEDQVFIFAGFDANTAADARGRLVERTTRTYYSAGKRGIRYKSRTKYYPIWASRRIPLK